ncbi:hypothetical protein L6164_011675 [Bauhinia variegata]|uniref:Uncharacterized protein n=1 Tax=Bauhinia variegata TaxID=167791 RepID=A0ACB9P7J7_BAUVA|nr:hypothetical protein L6164_011675 [Bauhinia variegata]
MREMVEKGIDHDTINYTILIDGFSKIGDVEKAIGFLARMFKEGKRPNTVTYTAIMSAYCKKGKLEEALAIFQSVKDMGNEPSIVTYNTVINGLCEFGRTSEADDFSKYAATDMITYSTLLHGYMKEENIPGILQTKRRLEEARISMDIIMFNVLIKALFMVGAYEDVYALYKAMPEMDLVADSVTYCTMIDGYCKVCRIDEALGIFDDLRKASISSSACYNSIVNGLSRRGITLNIVSYNSIMNGLLHQGCLIEAFRLFDSLEKIGLVPSEVTYATFIYALSRDGFLLDAKHVFGKMVLKGFQPNIQVNNSLLDGFSKFGQLEEAFKLLNDTKVTKFIEPDSFTVSTVINCYCQKEEIEGAFAFFSEFKRKGISPDFLGFLYLIRGLCVRGRMEGARNVLREMLQSKPVMYLINIVNAEVETESRGDFLVFLCEQGSIQEAVNEIASLLFPVRRLSASNQGFHIRQNINERNDFATVSSHKTDIWIWNLVIQGTLGMF